MAEMDRGRAKCLFCRRKLSRNLDTERKKLSNRRAKELWTFFCKYLTLHEDENTPAKIYSNNYIKVKKARLWFCYECKLNLDQLVNYHMKIQKIIAHLSSNILLTRNRKQSKRKVNNDEIKPNPNSINENSEIDQLRSFVNNLYNPRVNVAEISMRESDQISNQCINNDIDVSNGIIPGLNIKSEPYDDEEYPFEIPKDELNNIQNLDLDSSTNDTNSTSNNNNNNNNNIPVVISNDEDLRMELEEDPGTPNSFHSLPDETIQDNEDHSDVDDNDVDFHSDSESESESSSSRTSIISESENSSIIISDNDADASNDSDFKIRKRSRTTTTTTRKPVRAQGTKSKVVSKPKTKPIVKKKKKKKTESNRTKRSKKVSTDLSTKEKDKTIPCIKVAKNKWKYGDFFFSLNDKTYQCDSCENTRQGKYAMTSHIRIKHMGIFTYSCQTCGVGADTIGSFIKHQVKAHFYRDGLPEFQLIPCAPNKFLVDGYWTYKKLDDDSLRCLHCSFKCTGQDEMVIHMRNHTYIGHKAVVIGAGNEGGDAKISNALEYNETNDQNNEPSKSSDAMALVPASSSQQESREEEEEGVPVWVEETRHYNLKPGRKTDGKSLVKSLGNGKFIYFGKYGYRSTEYGLKCDTCEKFNKSRQGILRHIRLKHVSGMHNCARCEQSFLTKAILDRHWCNPKKYGQTVELSPGKYVYDGKWEFEKVEGLDNQFKCTLCGLQRSRKEGITDHIRETHAGILSWICDTCGKKFNRKQAFDGHVATHSNERPYICEVCGKTYKCKHDLAKHKRLTHTRGKEYACSECNHILKTSVALNRHKKSNCGLQQRQRLAHQQQQQQQEQELLLQQQQQQQLQHEALLLAHHQRSSYLLQ